jgi:hypothetical protein
MKQLAPLPRRERRWKRLSKMTIFIHSSIIAHGECQSSKLSELKYNSNYLLDKEEISNEISSS